MNGLEWPINSLQTLSAEMYLCVSVDISYILETNGSSRYLVSLPLVTETIFFIGDTIKKKKQWKLFVGAICVHTRPKVFKGASLTTGIKGITE